MNNQAEGKSTHKYSREIVMPKEVARRYDAYCKKTRMKLTEPLRVMVMESLPQLYNAERLNQIIEKTKKWESDGDEFSKYHVRLPDEVIDEIHTYCNFFHLKRQRCHFLYYLIEEKLAKSLGEVLDE